jgi:ERCC4-type nuclease
MKVIIDNREPEELIAYVKNLAETSKYMNIETANLDIGDIWIYKDDKDITKPDIILERKSISDLIASLKDGRYNEQSFRLDKFPIHNHNIFYIIEGSIERLSNPTIKQTIYSSMFTLSHFKGFSVLNTQNVKQTGEIIFRFSDKLLRENKKQSYYTAIQESTQVPAISQKVPKETQNQESQNQESQNQESQNQEPPQYSSAIKASKKSNITQDNILEIMLMQIPSVSANVAQMIGLQFKNMKQLIHNLEKDKNCLNGILINGKRKIAKSTINNIITFVLNDKFEIEVLT